MKNKLQKKLEEEILVFSDEEVNWLLTHIGDERAIIRDNIVFILLARGIASGGFTESQFRVIVEKTINDDLLFFNIEKKLPETLTRSFTALLNGFIIEADGNKSSPYYSFLSEAERTYFFDGAINYLYQETDKTGYSERYGWVHAFAHGGDFLSKVIQHELCTEERFQQALEALSYVMTHLETPFKDKEEKRLAHVIYTGILTEKYSQKTVVNWIEKLDFPLVEVVDFYQLAAFEEMLAYVYFHSLDTVKLSDELLEVMLVYLKKI